MYWIHPHYSRSELRAPLPNRDAFKPFERRKWTTLFFPLAEGEKVAAVWLRHGCNQPHWDHRENVTWKALELVLLVCFLSVQLTPSCTC